MQKKLALEEVDLVQLNNYWSISYKLGSRGVIIRTLINQGADQIVSKLVKRNWYTPGGYRYPSNGPYDFKQLMTPYWRKQFLEAIKNKDFVTIEKLLDDSDFARDLDKEFQKVYEYYREGEEHVLSMEELASFLYLLLQASILTEKYPERLFILQHVLDIILEPEHILGMDEDSELQSETALREDCLQSNSEESSELKPVTRDLVLLVAEKIKRRNSGAGRELLQSGLLEQEEEIRDLLLAALE